MSPMYQRANYEPQKKSKNSCPQALMQHIVCKIAPLAKKELQFTTIKQLTSAIHSPQKVEHES